MPTQIQRHKPTCALVALQLTVFLFSFRAQVQEALAAPSSSRRLLQASNRTSASTSAPSPERSATATEECDVPVSKNEETVVVETVISTRVDQVAPKFFARYARDFY